MLVSFALHRSFKIGILWSFSLCIFQMLFKSTGLLSFAVASIGGGGDDDDDDDCDGDATVVLLVLFVGIIRIRSNFDSFGLVPFLAVGNFQNCYTRTAEIKKNPFYTMHTIQLNL